MPSNTPHAIPHVLDIADHPWALTPSVLAIVATVLARRIAGRGDDGAWAAALPQRPPREPVTGEGVAVIPVHGVLAPRMNMLSDISGGASYETLADDVRAATDDPSVGTIVLDFDTPGGSTAGVSGAARAILAARARKTVIAQVEHRACSAGYWLAACASEIVAAPLSQVGSIGVYAIHENLAAALAKEGVDVTYIAAGKYKVEGNETGPLSVEALAHRQAMVDEAYAAFVSDIALGRGVSAATVRASYGEGRVLSAAMAKDAGMIDRVATLDETLSRVLSKTGSPSRSLRAQSDTPQEPSQATGQDRSADLAFARTFEADLFERAFAVGERS